MKNLIFVAVLLLIVSSLSFGQSASANVTANVTAALTIVKTNDLALSTVTRGSFVKVLSKDAAAAAFTITGTAPSQGITVTVSSLTNLTSAVGGYTMPFTQEIPIHSDVVTGQSTALDFSALTGGPATTDAVNGNLWVWIGGSVTASAGQAAGSYSGTFTVSVTIP
jgi:hypothetical protein